MENSGQDSLILSMNLHCKQKETMSVESVSCQIWWIGCDIARCRPCYDQTVSETCKLGWHTFIPLTQTESIFPHFKSVLSKGLWSPVDWWQRTEYEFVLVWNLHRSSSPGSRGTLLPLTTGCCCDETLCKQTLFCWSGTASHWSRACIRPSDWLMFPVCAPSLWSSLQFVAHAASALSETIRNKMTLTIK